MEWKRAAGILLHPTSLPSKYGIGDLGDSAYNFVNFLKSAGQTYWQVFPLGPTGYGDSPYQCFSAFAGNPYLISPDLLIQDGLLDQSEIEQLHDENPHSVDYGKVINYKVGLLSKAYEKFKEDPALLEDEYEKFCEDNKIWLNDFALFMACKKYHGGKSWNQWEEDIKLRKDNAAAEWTEKLAEDVEYNKFIQCLFFRQWNDVKQYANQNGITIIGDLPIVIAYDSSDAWANKNQFTIDDNGNLESVAGVPPDYFSATGQLWGNPLYRWNVMREDGYKWWVERFKQMFTLVDIVRIDHFRGFAALYTIPGDAETAEKGEWIQAPGEEVFTALEKEIGDAPIIAEDLGFITPDVTELRKKFNFPGMKILQFAFGEDAEEGFLPHNHEPLYVVYTGSHDNDTTRGFFEKEKEQKSGIYEWAQDYLNYYGDDIRFQVMKTAYESVADTVIIPMQDVLNLGTEARMNFPGTTGGNWQWRFTWDQISDDLAGTLKEMTEMYGRPPKEKKVSKEVKAYVEKVLGRTIE